jgi:hypothetical protein
MRAVGQKTDQEFQDEAFTRQFVLDKLGHFSELRRQHDEGTVNATVSRAELSTFIDHWLGTLCELDELFWVPKTKKEKRIMGRKI